MMKLSPRRTTLWTAPLALVGLAALGSAQETRVISTNATLSGDEDAGKPKLSDDGRWIVFESLESGLVPGDTNGERDVFLFDRVGGTIEMLSLTPSGQPGDEASHRPSISASGQRIVFTSNATNLATATDANGISADVFLLDRSTGDLQLISRGSGGQQADLASHDCQISPDGRYVVFGSDATNLVPNDTNGFRDVYWRDSLTKTTQRVSLTVTGAEPDSDCWQFDVSGNGKWVVFESGATNLVPNDLNGKRDLFLRSMPGGLLFRVSVTASGAEANGWSEDPALSDDGRWLAFLSDATNLVPGDTNGSIDVFVKDLQTGVVTRASLGSSGQECTGWFGAPRISPDGRYVSYYSNSPELWPGTPTGFGIFLRDLQTGITELISVASDGTPANENSFRSDISADARFVAFESSATNVDPKDGGAGYDIYLRDRIGGPSSYCTSKLASPGCIANLQWFGTAGQPASPFVIRANKVVSQKNGLFFYGSQGPTNLPFQGGTLCVLPPLRRTPIQNSGGLPGFPCNGSLAFDFNAWIQSGNDAGVKAGQAIHGQFWYRDPAHPDGFGVGLSNAIHFEIED